MKVRWIAAALGVAMPLAAQMAPPIFSPAVKAANADLWKGRYLASVAALKQAAFAPDGAVRDPIAFQLWSQFSPMMTSELPLGTFDRLGEKQEAGAAERVSRAIPHDAIDEIVRRARATSIVVLNENHTSPRDRAFGYAVAKALRPLGYRYLAVETLDDKTAARGEALAARLASGGPVLLGDGGYTADPVFAAFLRGAVADGYRPIAYEETDAQTARGAGVAVREQAEADNLMARIFTREPSAKVLIYVGHSHVTEEPIESSHGKVEWMAARLKRMTGIDPLTIDQSWVTDLSPTYRDAYAAATAKMEGRDSAAFFTDGRPLVLGAYAGAVDLQVIHPSRRYRDGRPDWLAFGKRRPLAVPTSLLPRVGARLVQVFGAADPIDAVPLDQVLVTAGSQAPMLFVPPGPVRFASQDAPGPIPAGSSPAARR